MKTAIIQLQFSAKRFFNHLFREEKGGSEIIALIVIIAIVIALAFAFREQIGEVFAKLWEMVKNSAEGSYNETIQLDTVTNPFGKSKK